MFEEARNLPPIYQRIIKINFLAWLVHYETKRLFFTIFIDFLKSLKLGFSETAWVVSQHSRESVLFS